MSSPSTDMSPRKKRDSEGQTSPTPTPAKNRRIIIQVVSFDDDDNVVPGSSRDIAPTDEKNENDVSTSEDAAQTPSLLAAVRQRRKLDGSPPRRCSVEQQKLNSPAKSPSLSIIAEDDEPVNSDDDDIGGNIIKKMSFYSRIRSYTKKVNIRTKFYQCVMAKKVTVPRKIFSVLSMPLPPLMEIEEWLMEDRLARRAARNAQSAGGAPSSNGQVVPATNGDGATQPTLSHGDMILKMENQERLLIHAYENLNEVVYRVVGQEAARNDIMKHLDETFVHVQDVIWNKKNESEAYRLIEQINEYYRVLEEQAEPTTTPAPATCS